MARNRRLAEVDRILSCVALLSGMSKLAGAAAAVAAASGRPLPDWREAGRCRARFLTPSRTRTTSVAGDLLRHGWARPEPAPLRSTAVVACRGRSALPGARATSDDYAHVPSKAIAP